MLTASQHTTRPLARLQGTKAPLVLHTRVVAGRSGGPDKTILRSARYIDPSRYQIAAAYLHPHGDAVMDQLRGQAQALNCSLWEIGESGAIDPRAVQKMLNLCRDLGVTVWHGHDYKSNLLGLLLRRFWPMTLVTTAHGWTWETARTRFYYHVDNWCLRRYEQVIVVSPKLYEHCRGLGIPEDRLHYIPNAIETADFTRRRSVAQARQELGLPEDRLIIGAVGRLSVEKGFDRAIRALAELRQTLPQVELHLIGDGPERESLKALAVQLGVAEAVRFLGWQNPLHRHYEAMDLLLLSSHTEGMPNVVLEAMAMGVPVAATDVGGVSELLDGGRCGVILDQNEGTWARAMLPLLQHEAIRQAAARLARRRVESQYSFGQRIQRVMDVYDRALNVRTALRRAA